MAGATVVPSASPPAASSEMTSSVLGFEKAGPSRAAAEETWKRLLKSWRREDTNTKKNVQTGGTSEGLWLAICQTLSISKTLNYKEMQVQAGCWIVCAAPSDEQNAVYALLSFIVLFVF